MDDNTLESLEKSDDNQEAASNTTSNVIFDKNKARKNVLFSVIFKIVLFVVSFVARRYLINYIGNDANGLNSLFLSIINFLSIVDLGIGTAIIYCMYEPIEKGDINKVSQLYFLFKRIYIVLGIIFTVIGVVITFFLPFLAKGYDVDWYVYLSYLLTLLSAVLTFFYMAKMSLINAYKNNYVTTTITSVSLILTYVIQVIVIVFTKSFVIYCAVKSVSAVVQLVVYSLIHRYDFVTKNKQPIEKQTTSKVVVNVKAMILHKIGDVIFGTVDSIVISSVIGVVVLGFYSNYLTLLTAMNEVIKLFIISLTSVLGHMGVKASADEKYTYFKFFYKVNFLLGVIFYLGYFSIASDLVQVLFGDGLSIDTNLIIVMTITYFIQFMRQSASVFKDSFGLFYKDRYVSIIASILNIGLSVGLAFAVGIYGVLIATIIVDLLIFHVVEPFVLFKYSFERRPTKYYIVNYLLVLFFTGEVFLFSLIHFDISNVWLHLLTYGSISVCFNILPITVLLLDQSFRTKLLRIVKR